MKIKHFEDEASWMQGRRGLVTGTRAADVLPKKRGEGKRAGFWEIIAERVSIAPDGENPMERGRRLEEEAIQRFMIETGKDVNTDLVIWSRDDNSDISVSPDGSIGDEEAVECKCLSSAKHIEAWWTKTIPSEYRAQGIQYFVVNDKLKTLHFVFFDPRIPCKDYFTLTLTREEVAEEIVENLEAERIALLEIESIVKQLTA